jgi:HSP20 family protein
MTTRRVPASGGAKGASAPRIVDAEQLRGRPGEIFDLVARRAYDLFEQRGREHGAHDDDWFRAEAELLHPVSVDVSDEGEALVLRAEVEGFTAGDIEVGLEPHRITLVGSREAKRVRRKGAVLAAEVRASQFFRMVDLPAEVQAAGAEAAVKDGVLELVLRKAGAPAPARAAKRPRRKAKPS